MCVGVCVRVCVCVTGAERQKGRRPFQGELVMLSDKDKQRWGLLLPREGRRGRRGGGGGGRRVEEGRRSVSASLSSSFFLLCHFFNYPSLLRVPIDPEAGPASFRLRACLDSDYSLLSSRHSLPSHTHTHTHTHTTHITHRTLASTR